MEKAKLTTGANKGPQIIAAVAGKNNDLWLTKEFSP